MDIVDRLRSWHYELRRRQASTPFGEQSKLDGIPELLYEAAIKIQDLQDNEIERLRAERDAARRIACEKEETLGIDDYGVPRNGSARDHAKQRGWDCFDKENADV